MSITLNEKPIFIGGYERSGTTMLMLMIGSHPRITVPEVTWFYPRFRPYLHTYGDLAKEENFRVLAHDMIFGLLVPFFGVSVNQDTVMDEIMEFIPERSFEGAFAGILQWFVSKQGKPRWVEKCPQNIFHISSIMQDFPNAQIVYITRDGRDSGATYMQSRFGPTNVFAAADLWKKFQNAASYWRGELDSSQWLDVSYEKLVREPEKTLEQICEFLGEDYSPSMLDFHKGSYAQARGEVPDHAPIATPVTDKLIGEYKQYLSVQEQQIFAGVAGEELTELGYDVDVEPLMTSNEDASRLLEMDMRTRAAIFDLMGHQFEFSNFNEGLVERWGERKQQGVWSDSDRPENQDPRTRLWMDMIEEGAYWKSKFGTNPS